MPGELFHEPVPGQFDQPFLLFLVGGPQRLIGDRQATEKLTRSFDRVVLDQGPRLARWAAFLRGLQSRVETTYVFVNNHYAGYAPGTLDDLQKLVRQAMSADDAPF